MRTAWLAVLLLTAACGGGTGGTLVTIGRSGFSPSALSLAGGASVQFMNADAADHQIESTGCAELASPRLTSGDSFTATLGTGPKTCSFDDKLNPSMAAFQGTITVTTVSGGGGNPGGY